MGDRKLKSARIEELLRSVDETKKKAAAESGYPKPFQQVIQELEVMAEFASKFPKIPKPQSR